MFQHSLKFVSIHKNQENVIMNIHVPITWLNNYHYVGNTDIHFFLKHFKAILRHDSLQIFKNVPLTDTDLT